MSRIVLQATYSVLAVTNKLDFRITISRIRLDFQVGLVVEFTHNS